jgi:hypothetical protein
VKDWNCIIYWDNNQKFFLKMNDLFLRDDFVRYMNMNTRQFSLPPARNDVVRQSIPNNIPPPLPEPPTTKNTSTPTEEELKDLVTTLKSSLKDKRRFKDAVPEFLELMNKHLNYENKRLFYDGLNIVSYRVGKPGFDANLAKQLFDAALTKKDCFSPGYRRNIEDWKQTVENLISGTNSSSQPTNFFKAKHQINHFREGMVDLIHNDQWELLPLEDRICLTN